jgi:hypothetical protein
MHLGMSCVLSWLFWTLRCMSLLRIITFSFQLGIKFCKWPLMTWLQFYVCCFRIMCKKVWLLNLHFATFFPLLGRCTCTRKKTMFITLIPLIPLSIPGLTIHTMHTLILPVWNACIFLIARIQKNSKLKTDTKHFLQNFKFKKKKV